MTLNAQTRARYFAEILRSRPHAGNTSFFMLGWTPPRPTTRTTCCEQLIQTPSAATKKGGFNPGGYSNKKLDELSDKIEQETDKAKRDAMLKEAQKIHLDEVGPHSAASAGASSGPCARTSTSCSGRITSSRCASCGSSKQRNRVPTRCNDPVEPASALAPIMLAFIIRRLTSPGHHRHADGGPDRIFPFQLRRRSDQQPGRRRYAARRARRLREQLGLNDPFPIQFGRFVLNGVQGDFGLSYRMSEPVMGV